MYFRDILNHPFSRHVPKKLLRHNDVAFASATNAASHNSHDAGGSGPKNQVLHEPVSTGTLQVKMTYKFPLGGDCTAALHNKKTQPNEQLGRIENQRITESFEVSGERSTKHWGHRPVGGPPLPLMVSSEKLYLAAFRFDDFKNNTEGFIYILFNLLHKSR